MVWDDLLSLILSIVFGAIIGLERELHQKAAGLRTNVLICLGAAIFTIIARRLALGDPNAQSRVIAQILTGVGFIGGGAIIRDTGGIHGLTTAATIWLVASIGAACGGRLYYLAAISTAAALLVLVGLANFEKHMARSRKSAVQKSPEQEHNA